jgi:predicted kinase
MGNYPSCLLVKSGIFPALDAVVLKHNEWGTNMPKCYQLIGVPGAGKSTWVSNQNWAKDCAYVSTDKYVEQYAVSLGKTYNEVFDEFMPEAVNLMCQDVIVARSQNKDVIWDQTSVSVKSRKRKFNMLPDYEHIAVVFKTPEKEELDLRLASRPGKAIPTHVMRSMIEHFDMPTEEEGFTEIWYAG